MEKNKKHISKRKLLIICGCGIVISILMVFLFSLGDKDPFTVTSDVTVKVENGICTPASSELDFEILSGSGKSITSFIWGDFEKEQGFITTAVVRDKSGNEVFCLSGDSVNVEMYPTHLEEGKYTVELGFITTEKEYLSFISNRDFNHVDKFDFEPVDGTYNMTYTVSVRPDTSLSLIFLITFVFIFSLLVCLIICTATIKGDSFTMKYDERQLLARGSAFKAGFFTILIMTLFMMIIDSVEINLPVDNTFVSLTIAFTGIMVFLGVAIWEHAYYALNERKKTVIIMFVFIGVANFLIGISNICKDSVIEDGILKGYKCINLMCGFLFVFIGIITGIRVLADKREELYEEDTSDEITTDEMKYLNGGQKHEES